MTKLYPLICMLLLAGCATAPVEVPRATTEPIIPADRILLRFETLGCACNLADVDFALLELPGVSRLEWEAASDRVWLIFLEGRRPDDEQIRAALKYSQVKILQIQRP